MRPERILVVEDDAGWIELLKIWFPSAGYKSVEYAVTGAEVPERALLVAVKVIGVPSVAGFGEALNSVILVFPADLFSEVRVVLPR